MSSLSVSQIRDQIAELETERGQLLSQLEVAQYQLERTGIVIRKIPDVLPDQAAFRRKIFDDESKQIAVLGAKLEIINTNLARLRTAESAGTSIDYNDPESSLISEQLPSVERPQLQESATVLITQGQLDPGTIEDFRFSPTELHRNNPEAYEEYLDIRNREILAYTDAIRQDPTQGQLLSVTNAERVALTAVREEAEAVGALTVLSVVPGAETPSVTRRSPEIQSTNATGAVSVTPGSLESLRQQLSQQQDRRADFERALANTDREIPELRQRIRELSAISRNRAQNRDEIAAIERKIQELTAQRNQIATQILPEIDRTIVDLERQIDIEIRSQQTVTRTFEDDLQLTPATPVPAQQSRAAEIVAASRDAQAQAQIAVQRGQAAQGDWRVKLRLAGDADYLYRAEEPGILAPLAASDGVIFPYMPQITTSYNANYNNADLTHSNYRGYFYQSSYVGEIQIEGTFTAQDTDEANYLLAVIHFFRSVTKMFYGQDTAEYRGAPPPLVFLQGLGEFQFNLAPCVVQTFNYVLPQDVDYVRARVANVDGTNLLVRRTQVRDADGAAYQIPRDRLRAAGVPVGGIAQRPAPPTLGTQSPTYVPTQMQISLTLLPVQTRAQVSREFSFEQYANGSLIQRGFW